MNRTIIDFLNEQARAAVDRKQHVSFHMPGHKGRTAIYERMGYGSFIRNLVACDITEIPGADALFCPETTLRAVMDNYADLYGVRHTELLVNGSSAGVMAAIMASVQVGGKLIMGRNSHHSAFSALRLGGINPVYVHPEIDEETGLVAETDPAALEDICKEHPDAEAILITSPNYCGMMSDIGSIARIAHSYGMTLIVDQAHGAHLRFFDHDAAMLRAEGAYIRHANHSAESLGADIVINSTHKTLLSFTGSGVLNICTDRVDTDAVSEMLRNLQTTSPSYILMGSLDINERIMREIGPEIIKRWRDNLIRFYKYALRINGVTLVGAKEARRGAAIAAAEAEAVGESSDTNGAAGAPLSGAAYGMYQCSPGLDMTKINVSMAELGLSGEQLDRELRHQGIIPEMVHGEFVMLMTGAGNVAADYDRLLDVLKGISDSYGISGGAAKEPRSGTDFVLGVSDVPLEFESVPLYRADGRVLYDPVIVYPPGTPIACPGEIMSMEVIAFIAEAIERGEKVTGVDEEGLVRVGILR